MEEKQKIIVIGGGFAGVQFVKNIDENLFDILSSSDFTVGAIQYIISPKEHF